MVHAPDVLSPSSPDEVEDLMRSLVGVDEASLWLETWVENLREWMSETVGGGG